MINEEKTIEVLQQVALFQGLKKRQLSNLARGFVERSCATDEVIIAQGRTGYGFFIVISGKAEAYRELADGTKVVVNTFGPGDFFGEMALLDDGPRTATVAATEATECLILPHENFIGLLKRDAEMAVAILVELARRFRMTMDRL